MENANYGNQQVVPCPEPRLFLDLGGEGFLPLLRWKPST